MKSSLALLLLSYLTTTTAFVHQQHSRRHAAVQLYASQLAQLAEMTTISIDSGDIRVIQEYAKTGYITDATTNPLFVSQAGINGDPAYIKFVNDAVEYAGNDVNLAIDRLAVNLGRAIADIVPGYVSTEVDPRLSFNIQASLDRARRIIDMYEDESSSDIKPVSRDRILVKLAATWEGIQAASILEKEGIKCNLTLVFSLTQAKACAQYGAHLISPFPGRILDWHNQQLNRPNGVESPQQDEGVQACTSMFEYYKTHGYDTICMPASWRPSRGSGYDLDEIQALAGSDRMTIPAPLLEKLAACNDPLPQMLDATKVNKASEPDTPMSEADFRYAMLMDECGTAKMEQGIRAFIAETEKLQSVLQTKIQEKSAVGSK